MHGIEATGLGDPQGRGYREERGGPSPALRGTSQPPAHLSCRPKCKCNIKSRFPSSAQGRRTAACGGLGLWPRGQLLNRLSMCPGCSCQGGSEVSLCSPTADSGHKGSHPSSGVQCHLQFPASKGRERNEKGQTLPREKTPAPPALLGPGAPCVPLLPGAFRSDTSQPDQASPGSCSPVNTLLNGYRCVPTFSHSHYQSYFNESSFLFWALYSLLWPSAVSRWSP